MQKRRSVSRTAARKTGRLVRPREIRLAEAKIRVEKLVTKDEIDRLRTELRRMSVRSRGKS